MVSVNVLTFLVLKILRSLDVNKIAKNISPDLTLRFTEPSENVNSFI